jgi:hypothetical protein
MKHYFTGQKASCSIYEVAVICKLWVTGWQRLGNGGGLNLEFEIQAAKN